MQLRLVVGALFGCCEDVGALGVPVHLLVDFGEWPPRCLGPVRKYEEKTGVLGVDLEVSSNLVEELGDLVVCVDWVSVVVVASQTVSLIRISKSEVGHVDGLVVGVAAAAVRVAEGVRVL